MLYRVKRFRLLAALKVGAFGGLLVGALGGFLFLPLIMLEEVLVSLALGNFLKWANYSLDDFTLLFTISVGLAFVGAIIGAIAGAVITWTIGFFYNLTTRYTGGLLVELEPRGKLKERVSNNIYDHEDERIAPPLALDQLLEDEDDISETEVRANKSAAVRRQSS